MCLLLGLPNLGIVMERVTEFKQFTFVCHDVLVKVRLSK